MNMQEASNNDEHNLSQYYEFESKEEKEAYLSERADYFAEVSALVPQVEATKSKLANIKEALRAKIKTLEQQIKRQAQEKAKQQNKEAQEQKKSLAQSKNAEKNSNQQAMSNEDSLLKEDLDFCKLALEEGSWWDNKLDNDKNTLETILATQEKKSYRVTTDLALKPLPSDRAKENNKNKEQDKENNKDNKDKNKNKNADSKKISAEKLAALRGISPKAAQKAVDEAGNEKNLDNIQTKASSEKDKNNENPSEKAMENAAQEKTSKLSTEDAKKLRNGIPLNAPAVEKKAPIPQNIDINSLRRRQDGFSY